MIERNKNIYSLYVPKHTIMNEISHLVRLYQSCILEEILFGELFIGRHTSPLQNVAISKIKRKLQGHSSPCKWKKKLISFTCWGGGGGGELYKVN